MQTDYLLPEFNRALDSAQSFKSITPALCEMCRIYIACALVCYLITYAWWSSVAQTTNLCLSTRSSLPFTFTIISVLLICRQTFMQKAFSISIQKSHENWINVNCRIVHLWYVAWNRDKSTYKCCAWKAMPLINKYYGEVVHFNVTFY